MKKWSVDNWLFSRFHFVVQNFKIARNSANTSELTLFRVLTLEFNPDADQRHQSESKAELAMVLNTKIKPPGGGGW